MQEPMDGVAVRQLARSIMKGGFYQVSKHARDRMAKHDLQDSDVLNVLRAGWADVSKTSFEVGTWRYQIHSNKIVVVVAFRDKTRLTVITCWRKS